MNSKKCKQLRKQAKELTRMSTMQETVYFKLPHSNTFYLNPNCHRGVYKKLKKGHK